MKLDLTKPVQTRIGWPARIVSTKAASPQTVIAIRINPTGEETVGFYYPNGQYSLAFETDYRDLQNVPEILERWLNIYRYPSNGELFPGATLFLSASAADKGVDDNENFVVTVHIKTQINANH